MNCPLSVPVPCPVLTFSVPGAQALTGDVVELRCEDKRASPPVLYRFYQEDVTLRNTSAPSGGGASFNRSVTARHCGSHACEADNGLGAQRGDVAVLDVASGTSPTPSSRALVAVMPNNGLWVLSMGFPLLRGIGVQQKKLSAFPVSPHWSEQQHHWHSGSPFTYIFR